eukprot:NODE_973_length_2663_cov_0.317473.p1 type:complete len:174 gc:universal NODE_973_length_2663_cov_0.317473:629-1150(+)
MYKLRKTSYMPFHLHDSNACLFVASLDAYKSMNYLHHNLHQIFSEYGNLTSVKVFKDQHYRPYAFVQFVDPQDANTALKCNIYIDGRRVRMEIAKVNKTIIMQSHRDSLKQVLDGYKVEFIHHISNVYSNHHRGYSLVKFKRREDAQKCLFQLKHSMWQADWYFILTQGNQSS